MLGHQTRQRCPIVAVIAFLDLARLVADPEEAVLGPLHVYNAWLGFHMVQRDGLPVPDGEQDQNRQLDQLLGWVAGQHSGDWTERIVVGGTFNFPPESPLFELNKPALQSDFQWRHNYDDK